MTGRRLLAVVLMAVALILVTIGAVNADLKPTNVLRSFDDTTQKYENGNIQMFLDSTPQPFYTQLDFDNGQHPNACGVGTSSKWAGDTFVGLYNLDTTGGKGFQSTLNWKIVKCDAFTTGVKYAPPAAVLATCSESGSPALGVPCVLNGTKDTLANCSTGNCSKEIQTRFHVTIDTTCDDTVDEPFASAGTDNLCLYWEAVKPLPTDKLWSGNIQVRYNADNDTSGGDKTINFKTPLGPTAVSISSLAATAEANRASLAMWAGAMGLAAAALWLWRRQSAS